MTSDRHKRGHGRGIDDMPRSATVQHAGHERVVAVHDTPPVDAHHPAEILDAGMPACPERAERYARVVGYDVNAAELAPHFGGHALDLLAAGDIDCTRQRPYTSRGYLRGSRASRVLVDVDHCDMHTAARERQ